MTGVTNVDRLVLLLRQRLQERDRRGRPADRPAAATTAEPDALAAARALAAIGDADERQFRRALIQGLIADRLGPKLLNEARFQLVVDQVLTTLEADTDGGALLDRVSRDLKAQAR